MILKDKTVSFSFKGHPLHLPFNVKCNFYKTKKEQFLDYVYC